MASQEEPSSRNADGCSEMSALERFSESLSAPDQPDAAFGAFCSLANEEIGLTLFTALIYDKAGATVRRAWSNSPRLFPIGSVSPVPNPASYEAGLKVINDRQGIIEAFPHHEAILAVNCESSLALPVVVGRQFLGTLCLLHLAAHFTPDRVKRAQGLMVLGTVCFLIEQRFGSRAR